MFWSESGLPEPLGGVEFAAANNGVTSYELRITSYELRVMARKRVKRDERRWLKKAGFSREFAGMGELACALHEAETGPRSEGYVCRPDSGWGVRTRRRVRRERWKRFRKVWGCWFWRWLLGWRRLVNND